MLAACRIVAAAGAALLVGCASAPARTATVPAPTAGPGAANRVATAAELADGAGRKILTTHCTWCHDLREVTKFRGYYDRAQWRDIVITMVQYGAALPKQDVEVLTDYLTEQLGRASK